MGRGYQSLNGKSNLIDAIARGLLTPAVKARPEAAESEQTALLSDRGGKSDGVADLLLRLSDTYRELVESLEHIPERHIPRARASLSAMTGGAIRLIPDGDGRFLTPEFSLDGGRLFEMATGQKINVVAGAWFRTVELDVVCFSVERILDPMTIPDVCRNGDLLTPDNLKVDHAKRRRRRCRHCGRARAAEFRARPKPATDSGRINQR